MKEGQSLEGVKDKHKRRVLAAVGAKLFLTIRAAHEMSWVLQKAWIPYRLSEKHGKEKQIRRSEYLEFLWFGYVNYVYQFQEKHKLFLNSYNVNSNIFQTHPVQDVSIRLKRARKTFADFTAYRGEIVHEWHRPHKVMGVLPLVETSVEILGHQIYDEDRHWRESQWMMRFEMEKGLNAMNSLVLALSKEFLAPLLISTYKYNYLLDAALEQ